MAVRILTVGHSTLAMEQFVRVLQAHGVDQVADVRTMPRSRRNPQFGEDQLRESLPMARIGYEWLPSLGGLRRPRKDSVNGAWRNESFRGYADHMQSNEFETGLGQLIELATQKTVAVMCAEAVPWRCHRSLIGDALVIRGLEVLDIYSEKATKPHQLTKFAVIDGDTITYPAQGGFQN